MSEPIEKLTVCIECGQTTKRANVLMDRPFGAFDSTGAWPKVVTALVVCPKCSRTADFLNYIRVVEMDLGIETMHVCLIDIKGDIKHQLDHMRIGRTLIMSRNAKGRLTDAILKATGIDMYSMLDNPDLVLMADRRIWEDILQATLDLQAKGKCWRNPNAGSRNDN